jgi:hypothetical protein
MLDPCIFFHHEMPCEDAQHMGMLGLDFEDTVDLRLRLRHSSAFVTVAVFGQDVGRCVRYSWSLLLVRPSSSPSHLGVALPTSLLFYHWRQRKRQATQV